MNRPAMIRTISVTFVLILILIAGIGDRLYSQESSKSENPAVESAQMENPEKLGSDDPGKDIQIEIWLKEMREPLITAGFWFSYNPSQIIVSAVEVFDDSDLPGPWDHAMTKKIENPLGSGTFLVTIGNLANVEPDKNAEIKLAQIRGYCKGDCSEPITLTTISGFDTVVGDEGRVYDAEIGPFSFKIN